jgi:proteasome accessory factor B
MAVRVRFSQEVAESVRERTWHESQRITDEPDGGIVVSFEAGGKMEILAWVLSFSAHAVVLEPSELREEVRRVMKAMETVYEQPT